MYGGDVGFFWVRLPVEFRVDNAGSHRWNGDLLDRTDRVHLFIGEFYLPRVYIVDQFVAVHEVDADNVVVEFIDDVHRVGEPLPLDV